MPGTVGTAGMPPKGWWPKTEKPAMPAVAPFRDPMTPPFSASPIRLTDSTVTKIVVGLNPMTGVIDGFRWALAGGEPPTGFIWASVIVVVLLLVTGLYYFKYMERVFADVV